MPRRSADLSGEHRYSSVLHYELGLCFLNETLTGLYFEFKEAILSIQRISNALEFLCDGFLAEFLRTMSDNIRHISAKSKQKIGQKDKHKIFKALEMRCIPEVRYQHAVADSEKLCPKCGGRDFKKVGEGKISTLIELIPGRLERQVHIQETLACRCGEYMVSAESLIRP